MRVANFLAGAALTLVLAAPALSNDTLKTRFGSLIIQRLPNVVQAQGRVLYKGRPLHPDVHGNNNLYATRTFHLSNADAVLFEDEGGEACPSLWYIVTVSPSGAASTPEFGSCGPLLDSAQRGQTIVVRTRGFCGPFEPATDRARAVNEVHEYVYRGGVVHENGKRHPC
jgi:hypothetical protein